MILQAMPYDGDMKLTNRRFIKDSKTWSSGIGLARHGSHGITAAIPTKVQSIDEEEGKHGEITRTLPHSLRRNHIGTRSGQPVDGRPNCRPSASSIAAHRSPASRKAYTDADQSPAAWEIEFHKSGWLAVRAQHVRNDPDNWHHTITAAHSSPIYVTINDQLPAVKESAEYMTARLEATIQWAENTAMWSNDDYKNKALASFKQAQQFYQAALRRTE